jgi:glycosyltransferase involved in cell wall biosynthesis
MVVAAPRAADDVVTLGVLVRFAKEILTKSWALINLLKRAREYGADVIHVHNPRIPLVMGYFLHKLCGTPLIVTIHEMHSWGLRLNRLYTKADRIIAISPEVSTRVVGYGAPHDKLIVIPNMIDTDWFNQNMTNDHVWTQGSIHAKTRKLVIAGRIDSGKLGAIKTTMDSMPRIVRDLPDVHLLVVGNGPHFRELTETARSLNNQLGRNRIIMTGFVKDIRELLASADIVVGVGRVAMEAMACSKPVIVGSANKSGVVTGGLVTMQTVEEFRKHNFTGRFYPENLDSAKIFELVRRLMIDGAYRQSIGAWSREYVKENFGAREVAKRVEAVYVECLE